MKDFERNIRQREKDKFKQHILKMVLTRLDFAPLFGFETIAPLYQKQFLTQFPKSDIESELGYDVDMSNLNDPKMSVRDHKQVYCLSNNSEKKKIKFSPTSIILEHHKYIDFDSFFQEFSGVSSFVLNQAEAVFTPSRLGLRKINSFVLKDEGGMQNFDGFFRDELTRHLKMPFIDNNLSFDRHFMTFSLPAENLDVNFQFSTEKGKKEGADSRRYILDIDVFSSQLPVDLIPCIENLKKMNDLIFDIFWSSIGPKMETFLKGELGA